MVKIRLQRYGKKHYPVYHIVVANSKSPRNGKVIEKLGIYNPHLENTKNKIIIHNKDTIKKWINNGAKPTKTVRSILKNLKII